MSGVTGYRQVSAAFGAIAMALIMASCASFGGLDRYDPAIEAETNAYHIKTVAFVSATEKDAGLPAGQVTSERSKAFYSEQGAVLANLVVRAEAANAGGACAVDVVRALIPDLGLESDATVVKASTQGVGCTVIVLRHLQSAHADLEAVHDSEIYLRPPVSTIALAAIGDAVRIVLRNEKEKR